MTAACSCCWGFMSASCFGDSWAAGDLLAHGDLCAPVTVPSPNPVDPSSIASCRRASYTATRVLGHVADRTNACLIASVFDDDSPFVCVSAGAGVDVWVSCRRSFLWRCAPTIVFAAQMVCVSRPSLCLPVLPSRTCVFVCVSVHACRGGCVWGGGAGSLGPVTGLHPSHGAHGGSRACQGLQSQPRGPAAHP
jgi:hypothetical protein